MKRHLIAALTLLTCATTLRASPSTQPSAILAADRPLSVFLRRISDMDARYVLRDNKGNVLALHLRSDAAVTDAELAMVAGLSELRELRLQLGPESKVSASGLYQLRQARKLRRLNLRCGSGVDDELVANLVGLTQLTDLDLTGANISDTGVALLRGLGGLERLSLTYTRITDAGLLHLTALPRLRELDLRCTRVTGPGLLVLHGRRELRVLRVPINIAEDDLLRLHDACPGLCVQ